MSTNREAFDHIAESWYRVRHWPLLRQEIEDLAQKWEGGKLLNAGCAHGPDFLPFRKDFELWGIDTSAGMLRQSLKYSAKFHFQANLVLADAVSLPFPDNTFDWAISVATYHHIEGSTEREKAFRELRRVLKPSGEAFLTVWNHWQPRFWLKSKEQQVPWRLKGKTLYRYYHLFSYCELKRLLARADFRIVALYPEKSYRFPVKNFSRNICALVKK
ncbi:MAG: class I SAM-dependent methyltransferase [Chloroflexota bacterium]|nr:class I SAM-dependent methyltransferase [Chloroflexota bacterium]